MTTTTRATPHLFTLRQRVYAVSAKTCHPDTSRKVILHEGPCAMNNGRPRIIYARYIDGKYQEVGVDWQIEFEAEHTMWMESPHCEGPYYVGNITQNLILKDKTFTDPEEAAKYVNEQNMLSFGNPTYSVTNECGILVDHQGYLTQYVIPIKE